MNAYPELRAAVMSLDSALTCGQFVKHNAWQRFKEIEEPLDVYLAFICEYYLSDGGYSRVFWDVGTHKLLLTDNSTDVAKRRWRDDDVVAAREAVEREIWTVLGPYLEEVP